MLRSPESTLLGDPEDIASLARRHPRALGADVVDGVPGISHAPVLLDGAEDDAPHGDTELAATMRWYRPEPHGERA